MITTYDVVLYLDGDFKGERKRFFLLKPRTPRIRVEKRLFLRLSLYHTINGDAHKLERRTQKRVHGDH